MNVIKIEEFEVDTVKLLIEFLYSGDYSVTQEANLSDVDAVTAEGLASEGK